MLSVLAFPRRRAELLATLTTEIQSGPTTRPLVIANVSKTYHDGRSSVPALDRVNLKVAQRVRVPGRSLGCGKTTLLNLIAGIYRLDHGSIDTGDRRIGMVFQEPALFPWLTVARNIDLAMRLRGVEPNAQSTHRGTASSWCTSRGFERAVPTNCRVGCSGAPPSPGALAQEADLLLMDEPFGSLDAMTRDRLHDELERIWLTTDLTILFVTHNVREAVRLGDRVVVLGRPGRVAAEFTVDIERPRRADSGSGTCRAQVTDRLRQRCGDMVTDSYLDADSK